MEKHFSDGTEPTILPHFQDTYPTADQIQPVRACRGTACQQGRKLCPHPEECLEEVNTRLGCMLLIAGCAALWALIIAVVWALW